MAGRKSERMANITTTLPIPLLEKIDELVSESKIPSRSHVIREAVRSYLKTFE
jgi:metal-responsive CopG/Arc/MetJ family transcriptional regulator